MAHSMVSLVCNKLEIAAARTHFEKEWVESGRRQHCGSLAKKSRSARCLHCPIYFPDAEIKRVAIDSDACLADFSLTSTDQKLKYIAQIPLAAY